MDRIGCYYFFMLNIRSSVFARIGADTDTADRIGPSLVKQVVARVKQVVAKVKQVVARV